MHGYELVLPLAGFVVGWLAQGAILGQRVARIEAQLDAVQANINALSRKINH